MKKLYYESPTVDMVDVRVESGFAHSVGENGDQADFQFDTYEDPDMGEVEDY